jgi:pseudouridine-5'-phosphate glycosidase
MPSTATLINRARPNSVALETTLLLHGVPKGAGKTLSNDLAKIVADNGGTPTTVGVVLGMPIVGLTDAELDILLAADKVAKANTSNLGLFLHARQHAATTVATTMELAAAAGVRVFATGGLGGVHRGYAEQLDISADLAAFTRFPVAVVTSGVKGLLDVVATREVLETLGIPVVGFETDYFPAFYRRSLGARGPRVDANFDDAGDLARFARSEMERTGRGIVVCNPIPLESEVPEADFDRWLAAAQAEADAANVSARDVTPFMLGALHRLSGGVTLAANIALVKSNAALAGQLAARMSEARAPARASK